MPGPDSEQPPRIIEAPRSVPDDDDAHVRDQFQASFPKERAEYDNQKGTKLITEALELTASLLEKNRVEGDDSATVKKSKQELESGKDHRVAEKMGDPSNEELLTLIDTIDRQTKSDLLFDLATDQNTPEVGLFLETLTAAGKSQGQLPIPADQLPTLIRTCARQQLLTSIGTDYLDKLAEFERKRAGAPQAMAQLTAETKLPESIQPS